LSRFLLCCFLDCYAFLGLLIGPPRVIFSQPAVLFWADVMFFPKSRICRAFFLFTFFRIIASCCWGKFYP
jgi:hypothetical protein